ncbi:MAG: S8 family serine peptidase [Magnetovibrio sp.]|nr:S8 family serine peptidase [Magnetovibrio sp.]
MLGVLFVRAFRLAVTVSLVLFLGTFLTASPSYSQSKVLTYDKNGHVIGSKTYQSKPDETSPKGQNSGASGSSGPRGFNPDTQFEPGELIISNPPEGFQDKIGAGGFSVVEYIGLGNLGMSIARIKIPSGMTIKDAKRTLARILPGVTIDANTYYDPSALRGYDRQTANPRAIAGWEDLPSTCGRGLVIGMIDAGVDLTHPALKGQDITYHAFTKPGRDPDASGHGTSVAAILIGRPEWGGLQPGAKLYAANMFEINEYGKTVGSAVGLLRAVDWMINKKVNALNLSIAGSDNEVVRQAFDIAKKKNLILVASVGNWGRADKPAFPAAYKHVIAVTAIRKNGLIYSHANTGSYVDFSALGVGIYTAVDGGGGKIQSGTSYSAPYVTVMAAILAKAGKAPTSSVLRKILSGATQDLGRPGKDNVFGFGRIMARPACRN